MGSAWLVTGDWWWNLTPFSRPVLYQTWFPAICLSRDLKRAKMPGNSMKSPFCFGVFLGVISKKKKSRVDSRIYFHSLRSPPGDPRVAHCSHFSVRILPPIAFFSPVRGPQGRSDTALRPDSNFWPHMQLGFPPSTLFRKRSFRTYCLLCAPPP